MIENNYLPHILEKKRAHNNGEQTSNKTSVKASTKKKTKYTQIVYIQKVKRD